MGIELHHGIVPANPRDSASRRGVQELLASCYHGEPNFLDLFPDPDRRATALPHVFAALLRDAARYGRVEVARRGGLPVGAALWLRPHAFPPGPARQARLAPDLLRVVRAAPDSVGRLMRFNRLIAELHPAQPYAYLAAIAVAPAEQGRGVGHELLSSGLAWVDTLGVACHLEAQRLETVSWYARHGFGVRTTSVLLPGGHPNWSMQRAGVVS